MKINKRGSQIPTGSSGFHSRKNSLRENSNGSSIAQQPINPLAQTANLHSILNSEKIQMMATGSISSQLLSESQPVLAKANEKPNIQLNMNSQILHKRNPSHQSSQQISLNEVINEQKQFLLQQTQSNLSGSSSSAAYMLKLQKYKKMKGELNNQTKSVIKKVQSYDFNFFKCLANSNNIHNSNNDLAKVNQLHKASNFSMVPPQPYSQSANTTAALISQSTKNSQASQINFNQPTIAADSKENSNFIANSQHYLQGASQQSMKGQHQKSQTIKFSINNLLSDLNNKSVGLKQLNHNDHNIKSVNMMQNVIATKNHTTLMNQQQHTQNNTSNKQQLVSSKMMMALHKKCNSIATSNINTSAANNYQQQQQVVSIKTTTHRESSQQLKNGGNISNTNCLVLDQDNIASNYSSNQLPKKQTPLSQVEFFDENVRVNQVPQITPRHQDKRKTINDRYSKQEKQMQPPQSTKNAQNLEQVTKRLIDFGSQNANNSNSQGMRLSKAPNNRYQDDDLSDDLIPPASKRSVFEMKRRSCGPSEQGHLINDEMQLINKTGREQALTNQQQALLQSQRFTSQSQANGGFGLRKFSQQVQFNNKLINKQEEIMVRGQEQSKQQQQSKQQMNPKEEIIKFFSKYIKQTKIKDNGKDQESSEYQETLQNLKDFLQYLEDKNIINCKRLENDKTEMTNLIQDLMKLDLNKFSNKQTSIQNYKGSPITTHHQNYNTNQPNIQPSQALNQNGFNSRRNSADPTAPYLYNNQQKNEANIKSPTATHHQEYGQGYKHKLPLNSPNNDPQSANNNHNIAFYYAPVNVSGNGNIVNAPMPQQLQFNPQQHLSQQKYFNCSQKLFLGGNQSSIHLEDEYDHENDSLRVVPSQQQQQVQQQPVFFNKQQIVHHKRVNSNKIPMTPSSALLQQQNQKFNFAFGGAQPNQQPYVVLETQQNKQHFHQRKNSLFISGNNEGDALKQQFYPQQQADTILMGEDETQDDNTEEAIPLMTAKNSRLTHRRATTNLINPSALGKANAQTIQVTSSSNGQTAVFCDDIGLVEERDKLIKYIKLFTVKCLEVPQTTLDYYKFMKLIGKGAFGKVTLGIHKLTGKQVAIKTVDKALMKDEYQKKKVLQEVHLLKKVRHQNVIRLLEVFESSKHLLMVMEYAGGGDLLQYVKKRRRLDEDEARRIFKQVVYGLAHCHCRSVLHRDIKLDNILLDNEGEIKICDFGVSRIIKKNQRITEQCGTPAYIAPEIISDAGYEGFNADIWSLGVLLYAMLCGTVPFKAQNMHDLHQIITSGAFQYPPQVEPLLSEESKDLINKMLVLNPKNRISIPEILSHPWIVNKDSDDLLLQDDMIDIANGSSIRGGKDLYNFGQSMSGTSETPGEPDINQVQIDNLFLGNNSYQTKLSYTDYCAITQDFATMHMNEEALQVMEGMGFPRKMVREGLNKGELNHATATYNLLVLN